jgi:hypothetical protein
VSAYEEGLAPVSPACHFLVKIFPVQPG